MKYSYDLHIHSVLSPCGDILNTPNNIVNMAMLKQLDYIAVCDHNSLKQLKVIQTVASGLEIIVIPACECSVDGFHVLAYFKNLEKAISFDQEIEKYITHQLFDEKYYGEQIITDIYDLTMDKYPYLLTNDLSLNINDLITLIRKYEGLVILAHIDKSKHSALNYLIDNQDLDIDGIELSNNCDVTSFFENYPFLKKYKYLINSDAHIIIDINERTNYLELEDKNIESFFKYFLT